MSKTFECKVYQQVFEGKSRVLEGIYIGRDYM